MGSTLGSLGSVTAVFDAQTEAFDKKLAASAQGADVTARAVAAAQKRQADAVAFASKFAGDAVTSQSMRIVNSMKGEAAASADYRKVQGLMRSGLLDETEGARAAAAAMQRLALARKEAADAGKAAIVSGSSFNLGDKLSGFLIGGAAIGGLLELSNKIKEAITSALDFGEAIQRASEKTGLAAGTLSTLHYAAAITGGDFEGMTNAVAKMDKAIGTATEGDKKSTAFLKSLGLNATDLAGRADGAEIAFRRFTRVLSETENPVRRIELATGLLGKAGAEQVPTLIQLGDNWDIFRQKAADAGVQLDGQTAASLEATQQRLKDLQQHVLGAGLSFAEGLAPALFKMLGIISGGDSQMNSLNDWGVEIGRGMALAASSIYSVAAGLENIFAMLERPSSFDKLIPDKADVEQYNRHKAESDADFADAKTLGKKSNDFYDIFSGKTKLSEPTPIAGGVKGDSPGFGGIGDMTGAAEKANQKRLKQAEAELALEKLNGSVSLKREFDFWENKKAIFKDGSDQYNAIVDKQVSISERSAARVHEMIAKYKTEQLDMAVEGTKAAMAAQDVLPKMREDERAKRDMESERAMRERMEGYRVSGSLAAEGIGIRETSTRENAGKGITKLDAAAQAAAEHQELASQHTQDFSDAMDELTGRRGYVSARLLQDGNTDPEKKRLQEEQAQLQAELARLQEQRAHQQMQDSEQAMRDQQAMHPEASLAGVGFKDALDDFVNASRDAAGMMRQITDTTLNSVNGAIMKDLTSKNRWERQGVWKDAGKGIFSSVADAGLKKGEGALLGAFGLGGGKAPKGTASDPLHVVMANLGVSGGGISPIIKNLTSGGGDGGIGKGLLSAGASLLNFLPGFAMGGDPSAGTTAWVGEDGPELVHFKTGAHVTPNGKTPPSGDTHHTWNIDARGASDPAQVDAAVQRGIAEAAPRIVAQSYHFNRDMQRRMPSTGR